MTFLNEQSIYQLEENFHRNLGLVESTFSVSLFMYINTYQNLVYLNLEEKFNS